jgi:hypothetical protein
MTQTGSGLRAFVAMQLIPSGRAISIILLWTTISFATHRTQVMSCSQSDL